MSNVRPSSALTMGDDGAEALDADGARLMDALSGIERPLLFEASVKAIAGTLRTGRFLVSFPRGALGPGPSRRLLRICEQLGAGAGAIAVLDPLQSKAVSIHFGYEPEPDGPLFKCYLEFSPEAQPSPDLVFVAVKWRPFDTKQQHVVTHYWTRDGLDAEAQLQLIDSVLPPGRVRDSMRTLLSLPAAGPGLRLLEVDEPGAPRRSLDLNVAEAGRSVQDLSSTLVTALGGAPEAVAYLNAHGGERVGHLAAGVARDGHPFATLYHGARRLGKLPGETSSEQPPERTLSAQQSDRRPGEQRLPRTSWELGDRIEPAEAADPPLDYCLWPYDRPAAAAPDALRTSALLYHSFAVAGLSDRMLALCDALQETVGPFGTVWGVKHAGAELSWEFYFYDYNRMERHFGTRDFIEATRGILEVTAPPADGMPYFMFSVEVDARHLSGELPVEQVDVYIGNPGSAVSSGICYGVSPRGVEMRNFYFFFDAPAHFHDIREKIVSNAFVPLRRLRIEDVLWLEMENAQRVVVANKRYNDGLYFSRIPVNELLFFMKRLAFPAPLIDFAQAHRGSLEHHLFDVGYDYLPSKGEGLDYLKGSYYGVL
jgi:hypothetical protein